MVTEDLFTACCDGEVEVGQKSTARVIHSDQFYSQVFTQSGRKFYIFAQIGDFVKGILLHGSNDNSHINRTKSYKIKVYSMRQYGIDLPVQKKQIEEFFTNRQLQRYIKQFDLEGKLVRIVFIGRLKSGYGGHSAKVYRVFIDKGIFEEKESECYEPGTKKHRRKKVAAGR